MRVNFYGPPPYSHQLGGLKRALQLNKSCALLMEPGTGKTRIAIDFLRLKTMEGLEKVLIVAPLSVLSVWEDEIQTFMPKKKPRDVIRLEGPVNKRIELLDNLQKVERLTIVLLNYDVIGRRERGCERCSSKVISDGMMYQCTNPECGHESEGRGKWFYPVRDALARWYPDCIIADESHFIKNPTSLRSKAMHYLGPRAKWRMILTGTVTTNSLLDVFSQYKFLDASIFGSRWTDFKYRYGIWGGYGGYQLMGFKNLKDLAKKMHTISFEASKDQLDLPGRSFQVVRIPLSMKPRKIYDEMSKNFITEIDKMGNKATASIILTKMLRLDQICGGFVRDENGRDVQVGKDKLAVLEELLENYVSMGKKVVVFSRFKWEMKKIQELCQKKKIDCGVFGGKNRDGVKKEFQDKNSEMSVLLAQIATGGVGINLTAASIGIFYSLDRSADHFTQACDRLHRPGQTSHVLYQFLLADKTSDISMYHILRNHQLTNRTIVHNWKSIVRGDII